MLAAKTTLTLVHQNVHQNQVPVFHKVQLENFAINQFKPQRRMLSYARLEQQLNQGIWKSLNFTASIHQTEEGRESQKNGSTQFRFEQDKVQSLGAIAQVSNIFSSRWSANSGVEVYRDLVKSIRTDTDVNTGVSLPKRGLYPNNATMTSIAAFTLHELDLTQWLFTMGARWTTFIVNVTDVSIGSWKLQPSA